MATVPHEKPPTLGPYTEKAVPSKNSTLFPSFSPLANAYSRFSSWRSALALPNPGSVENLQKEVKSELFAVCKSVGGNLYVYHSNTSDQFHLRRRASRPHERTFYGPGFPGHPFLSAGLAIHSPNLLIWRAVRQRQSGLRHANFRRVIIFLC